MQHESRTGAPILARSIKWCGLGFCALLALAWAASIPFYIDYYSDDHYLQVDLTGGRLGIRLWPLNPVPAATSYLFRPGWRVQKSPSWQLLWTCDWGTGQYKAYSFSYYDVPLYLPFVVIGIPIAFLFWRDRRRFLDGHCRKCGYDLRGNVSGVCPECGLTHGPLGTPPSTAEAVQARAEIVRRRRRDMLLAALYVDGLLLAWTVISGWNSREESGQIAIHCLPLCVLAVLLAVLYLRALNGDACAGEAGEESLPPENGKRDAR